MFKSKTSRTGKFLRQFQLVGRQQADKEEANPEIPCQDYLAPECHRTYSCIYCRAHLADHDELVSKLFQGNHGRAYLFNKVVNVGCKQAVERELLTGLHAVSDIYCDCCETTLGWKYEQAFVASQKYKEGKYIIELVHMLKENNWDLTSYNSQQLLSITTKENDDDTAAALTDVREIYVRSYRPRKMTGRLSSSFTTDPHRQKREAYTPQPRSRSELCRQAAATTSTTRQSTGIDNDTSAVESVASICL